VFEENLNEDGEGEPLKYHGFKELTKGAHVETKVPGYALLVYEKKKNAFRFVPVQQSINFEKVKAEPEKSKMLNPEVEKPLLGRPPVKPISSSIKWGKDLKSKIKAS